MTQLNEPIAIIGSSCRFAGGASSPSKLWDLLLNPRDVASAPSDNRFNLDGFYHENAEQHGNTNTHGGYFLQEDPRCFDTTFFNISPKEAEAIDPQQRILLELTYEAMESAGLAIQDLQGSNTSVYVGLMIRDYMDVQVRDPDYFSQYMVTGTSSALNANRISYFFDWHGPSLTVDTACSSSLVALHQAVQGLRTGESRVACVSGTNLLLGPELFISASNMHMLSMRSKMWDVSAEGYARGDGFVTFMLKTLSNALADGDHIEAVIRETGVNSDGRTKGITLPSPEAQTALIKETYQRAGLDITKAEDRCQYFEAHGTGTQAGDPLEASAVNNAFYGHDRATSDGNNNNGKLIVGSIKTIVGHTEGAAGMAGMMKTLLAMKHGVIPPNLHFHNLNPSVAPHYTHLQIPTAPTPWPLLQAGSPLRASVNSFGFGGTNAHAIMESYQSSKEHVMLKSTTGPGTNFQVPLLFSAHSEKALIAMVDDYATYLQQNEGNVNLRDLSWTLRARRSTHPVKATFSGTTASEIAREMKKKSDAAKATPDTELGVRSKFTGTKPCILGVFTGQGAQWPTMGKDLIHNSRLFSDSIDRLEKTLDNLSDGPEWSLRGEILAPESESRVAEAALSQPLCTAIAIALVDLLHASGVTFSAVVGHSSGEIGAAYAAGALTADEAIKIAYYRGVYAKLAEGKGGIKGAMLAVGMGFEDAQEFCNQPQFASRLTIAASNSPSGVTLSGDMDAAKEAKELLDSQKKFARMLQVDTAYHSHHMMPCAEPYTSSLLACDIQAKSPSELACSWISSVYGPEGTPTAEELASSYWRDNMAQTVRFSQALERAIIECGPFDAVLEVGPHPALKGPALQTIREVSDDAIPYVGALDRKKNDVVAFGDALSFLWLHFGPSAVDFEGYATASEPLDAYTTPSVVKDLPLYPWDHSQVYWRESRLSKEFRCRSAPPHELLGHIMPGGNNDNFIRWRNLLRLNEIPWLGNHRFEGQPIVPTSAFCLMAVEAALKWAAANGLGQAVEIVELQELAIHSAVIVPEGSQGTEVISLIQSSTSDCDDDRLCCAEFVILSGPPDGSKPLKKSASAKVILFPSGVAAELPSSSRIPDDSLTPINGTEFYASIGDMGLAYEGPFQGLQNIRRRWRRASALYDKAQSSHHGSLTLDPFFIESCIQTAYAAFSEPGDTSLWSSFLPGSIDKMSINLTALSRSDRWLELDGYITKSANATTSSSAAFDADVEIFDSSSGHLVVEVEGLTVTSFRPASEDDDRELFCHTVWKPDLTGDALCNDQKRSDISEKAALALEQQSWRFLNSVRSKWTVCPHAVSPVFESLLQFVSRSKKVDSFLTGQTSLNVADIGPMGTIIELLPDLIKGGTPTIDHAIRAFVEDHPAFNRLNSALQHTLDLISHRFANLKVLEVSSPHLGPSKYVLEGLGDSYSSLTFASTGSAEAVSTARVNYVSLETLSLSKSLLNNALGEEKFDVIIVFYALHGRDSSKIEQALEGLRHSIKPGGFLLLIEPTKECAWSRLFLNTLLASNGTEGSPRDVGKPLPMVQLDSILRKSGFSGIDSQLPSYSDGSSDAISFTISQAVDETIDLMRRPLQPSAMSLLDDQRLLIVGGKSLHTHRAIHNMALSLRPWTTSISIVDSYDDLQLDKREEFAGAIVLTDIDQPLVESLTMATYEKVQQLFQMVPRILWVTGGSLNVHPEQAASIGLGRSLSEEHPSVQVQFLDVHSLENCEEKILQSFIRLLIASLPDRANENRLLTVESEIAIRDGREMIPRVLPIKDMNDRLNSQRRQIKQNLQVIDTGISFSPMGSMEAATWYAKPTKAHAKSTKVKPITISYSLPFALKVSSGTFLYLFASHGDGSGAVLGLTESLSLPGPVRATWKVPSAIELGSVTIDRLLETASSLFIAKHIFQMLPAGESLIFEPEPMIASALSDLCRGTKKTVYFVTTRAEQESRDKSWIVLPAQASKRTILSSLPGGVGLFFDASPRPNRLVSRILQFLPGDFEVCDQSQLIQLRSRVSKSVTPTTLEVVLQSVGMAAVTTAAKFPESQTRKISLSELLDGLPKSCNGLGIVDWTQTSSIQAVVEPLNPGTLFSSQKPYVLVDIEPRLLQSISDWLILNGVRNLFISGRSRSKPTWRGTPPGTSVQFVEENLTNPQQFQGFMSSLSDVGGVIYGGAGPRKSSDDARQDVLQQWRTTIHELRTLTDVVKLKKPAFFLAISSLRKEYAPVNSYLSSLVSQSRSVGVPASLVSLGSVWNSMDGSTTSPFMRISESDLHYLLGEAISSAKSNSHQPGVLAGIKRFEPENTRENTENRWLSYPMFSHHSHRHRRVNQDDSQLQAQNLKQGLNACQSLEEASQTIQKFFFSKLAAMLNLPTESITPDNDLTSLGADSLSASDIRSWFLKELDADVSVLQILGGSSISDLCDEVASKLSLNIGQEISNVETNIAPPPTRIGNIDDFKIEPEEKHTDKTPVTQNISASSSDGCTTTTDTGEAAPTPHTEPVPDDGFVSPHKLDLPAVKYTEKMSYSQNRLWFPSIYLDQRTPFNCTTSYRLSGPIDASQLDKAFQLLIQRHESFRTAFYNDPCTGEPTQAILESRPFVLKVLSGNGVDDVDREFRQTAEYHFDLSIANTLIATLVSHGPNEHTIIFGYHHIIMDGVSWQITLNDLAQLYNSETADLPPLAQYADFAAKQRQLVLLNSYADKLAYWKKEIPAPPSPLPLFPFAKVSTRKALTRYNTLDYIFDVSPNLVAKIRKASLEAKCTSFHFYLSTFVVLLNQFLDLDDVLLGIIDANRHDRSFLNTVGFMLDLVPLRLKVNKKERYLHTLRNTRGKAYGALGNAGVPLETILKELQIPTSSTNTPLFQVLINYRMGALRAPQIGDAKMNFLNYEDAKAPFDLAISIDEKDDGSGMLTFSMQDYMYDQEGAELLVTTYVHLLDSLATDTSQRLNEVSMPKSLSSKALIAGTGPVIDLQWAKTQTLSQRVDWQTDQHPDALAVKDMAGSRRTYLQTQKRVLAIAVELGKAGIARGSHVAVYCEPTVDTIACILAIHRVGAVYIPLDVRNSNERLEAVVTECDPTLIIYHPATKEQLLGFAGRTPILDLSTVPETTETIIPNVSELCDPAFILFTSGSTGKPKGIMLTHANCSIHFASIAISLGLTNKDVVLQQSALGFDASLSQMFMAFSNGAALILGSNRGDPADLAELIKNEKVTVTLFIVSEMSALLQHGSQTLSECQSWRIALCGGEAFTVSLLQKFRNLDLRGLTLYNAYGPTEATIITSLGKVDYQSDNWGDDPKVPVGPPIPNYGVYVLDDKLQPAPLGWPGELCICGPGVTSGYVGQPDLTAAKFWPDRIQKPAGAVYDGWETIYRTGDKARQLSDGSFVFLGRIDGDSQVKIRGIRIELGEISNAIIQSSKGVVSDAATIVKGDTHQTLVSFVVFSADYRGQEGQQESPTTYLRKLIQGLPLPVYMRPAIAVPLDRLPFTERGKLDTKFLSAVPLEDKSEDIAEDLTPTEQKLRQVWKDTLDDQALPVPILRQSDFFSVGGNSLLLIRLRKSIEDTFDVSIPLANLFQASTLEMLAAQLDSTNSPKLEQLDWEAESALDVTLPKINVSQNIARAGKPISVLLTGSTGLLGREILRQLIANDQVFKVHCLAVRPGRKLPDDLASSKKIILHTGDLAAPRLGLEESEARELFSSAAAIIHNGAEVSHMKSYPSLRITNVGSTRQLLELAVRASRASDTPTPSFHYVSTAGVGGLPQKASFDEISVAPFPPASDGSNGYVAAKWASERILERAAETLGLSVTIHRPSNITGSSVGDRDIVHSVWRLSESLRAVPDLVSAGAQGAFDFVRVDTCARGVISSVFSRLERPEDHGVEYIHQSGDTVVPVGSFKDVLATRLGVDVSLLPFAQWVEKAEKAGLDELVAAFLRQTHGSFRMPLLVKRRD